LKLGAVFMSDPLTSAFTVSEDHQYADSPVETLPSGHLGKKAIDFTIAVVAFFILSPMFFVIAALVKLDGGPIFYTHPRIGRGGRSFNCYKFRSMHVNSEDLLTTFLLSNLAAAERWKSHQKLRDDPRITRIGKVLRKASLDELPQLINVIKMDMSLVGPRPILERELQLYGADVHKYYLFRPGITGLWQVSGRSNTSFAERVKYDVSYANGWSILLDLRIMMKTVRTVLSGSGAQ
jgi:exopolysaccharide production protein ExoY